ncbi:MAG: autotransporter-associated beta strand repeat-containing protein, partial [Verrucomicrobiota bacterium]
TGAVATTDGGLAKTGAGTLILTGANAYSGSTSVSGGILHIGNGGSGASIGSTSGVVLSNNSSLTFNHADSVIFSKPISGSGSLTKSGTGTLSVGTPQTYSGATHIAGGTLKLLARPVLTVTANLQLQLDAFDMASLAQNSDGSSAVTTNGQPVGYWSDKSGAGHHANVTTASKRPVYTATAFNGMPALNFDSTFAQEIWANYNIANGNPFTIAIVYRQTSLAGGNHALFGNDNGGWDRFQGLVGGANYGISNGGWQNYGQGTAMNHTDPIRYVFISRPGVTNGSEIWVNSVRVAQFTEGHDGSNTAQIAIGNISPNNGWNGNIQVGEVVAYGSALSDAERSTLDTYLNTKWFGGGGGSSGINLLPTDTPVSIASGAAVNLNGVSQQVASLADSAGSGGSLTNGGTDDVTLTISGNSSTSFGGVISNGATNRTALIKAGAGTLTLTGISTYTGTTNVSGGTLRVQGALGATATTVSATLAGNGSINAGVSLLAGGGCAAKISNWTGAAGSGFEDLAVQSLAITAGSHAVTIDTTGLTNFSDTNKVFAFLKTAAGITGFNAADFSVSAPGFSGSGTWALRQTGNNLELVYSNGSALPPYDSWAAAMGLTGAPGKESAFDADPDKDGIANGLEWILGGNPLASDRAIQPTVTSSTSSGLTLRFNRAESSIGQATLGVQWATNLNGTWTDVPVTQSGGSYANGVVVTVNEAATPDAVTVNIPAANAAGARIFARLKATTP